MNQTAEWPLPKRYELGGILNYVYDGAPVILFEQTWSQPPDTLVLDVSWLECADVCIPQSTQLQLDFPLVAADPRIQPARISAAQSLSFQTLDVSVRVRKDQTVWRIPVRDVRDAYWFPNRPVATLPKHYAFVQEAATDLNALE